jgi:PEP-CTERM motif
MKDGKEVWMGWPLAVNSSDQPERARVPSMTNLRGLRNSLLAGAVAIGVVSVSVPAHATLTETLSVPNSALSGFTGPYAQVSITAVDPNTANIIFTSLTTNGITFLMADGGSADLNVNGAYTLNLASLTLAGPATGGFTAPSFVSNTPGQVDGFGAFSLSLNLFDGYSNAANSISFQITNTTGLWTSDGAVLALNAQGANAAIHGFACTAPCTVAAGALATGFAANGGATNVPEPASIALLGTALMGLAFVGRVARTNGLRS